MDTRKISEAGAKGKVPAATTTEGTPEATTAEGAPSPEPEEIMEKPPVKGPALTPDEFKKQYYATQGFKYFGMDSTSIIEVTMMDGEPISHINALNTWAEEWLTSVANKEIAGDPAVKEAIDILDHTVTQVNLAINLTARTTADAAISIGKVLLTIQPIVSKKFKWIPWAAENLSFMSARSIQKYMRLAARVDAHKYTFLGLDALNHLCSVTEKYPGEDKISAFLKTYGIEDKPAAEFDLTEFKLIIDTGANCETLKKNGLEVDFETVKNLTVLGQKCDKVLINELLRYQRVGANPTNYLQLLIDNNGNIPSYFPEDEGKQKLSDVNSLSVKLVSSIDSLVGKHATKLKEVDTDILMKVSEKIKELIDAVSSQVTTTIV
jgi:hypothetical protein